MSLVSLRQILEKAEEGKYAVGAFNVVDLIQLQTIFKAALDQKSPLIIQATEGGFKTFGDGNVERGLETLSNLVRVYAGSEEYRQIDTALHLDHGESVDLAAKCIDAGFTSVMIDASKKSLAENTEITQRVMELARKRILAGAYPVSVEAELGIVGKNSSTGCKYTDPKEVVPFINATGGIDALAISWGPLHGANKAAGLPLNPQVVDGCYKEINAASLPCYLVAHGSSTVPPYLLEIINSNGGNVSASGIKPELVQQIIGYGVRKFNIATDISLAVTAGLRQHFAQHPEDWDPRKYTQTVKDAVYKVVSQNMGIFGSVGKAK